MSETGYKYIVQDENICFGKPRIEGTRMAVVFIASEYANMGWSPDEISFHHPGITVAQVHSALAYYYDHRQEIDERDRQGREFAERMEAAQKQQGLSKKLEEERRRRGLPKPEVRPEKEPEFGYIVKEGEICGGKPRIAGTRMKVEFVVIERFERGWGVEEICSSRPHLTEAEVRAALAYYDAHKEEIDKDIRQGYDYLDW